MTYVDTELDGVIAKFMSPVVYDLELTLVLAQGAVAAVRTQAGTEAGGTIDLELRRTARIRETGRTI